MPSEVVDSDGFDTYYEAYPIDPLACLICGNNSA